ncbi:copper homeostasis protein CutC [Flavobacterium sp.]|uniref:copper homeostasis protein CutC n=1 Tax=Flavobacterium sp. TaxID=239 RepID=UPI0026281D9D|nr:copper homeostasis protein CutC [Flavobacterium sp.]
MNKLEIACFNIESAQIAHENGADRIELCEGFEVGGTTPNIETIKQAREQLTIDLYVMIRPRGGNFVYSKEEFEQMKQDILHFKSLQVDGFVFGILNENNKVDIERNAELVDLAKPFPCTFHRAFDEISDNEQALEDVISCGFSTVLTSGTHSNVMDGIDVLKKLVHQAQNRITIMPGGGLRSTNIKHIQEVTQAKFYHSSAITDGNQIANATEIFNLKSNLK